MLNKAMLIGRLGKNPTIRYTPSSTAVCNFSIATSEKFTGKDGQKEWRTEWHNITVFNKLAEMCTDHLKKGSLVYLEGKLKTRSWEKDGVKRYTTEVLVSQVVFLDRKEGATAQTQQEDMDNIPF